MAEDNSSESSRGSGGLASSVLFIPVGRPLEVVKEEGPRYGEKYSEPDRYGIGRRPYDVTEGQFYSPIKKTIDFSRALRQLTNQDYDELDDQYSPNHRVAGCDSCGPYNLAA